DGVEIAYGVLERLALRHAGGVLLEAEHVGAERLRRHLERAAGARAVLEEEGDHVAAAQEATAIGGRLAAARARPLALEPRRQREQRFDLIPAEGLQLEQVAREVRRHAAAAARSAGRGP